MRCSFKLLCLFVFLVQSIFAHHWEASGVNMESGPMANVFGVNVISGEFIVSEKLGSIIQPFPYTFSMCFTPNRGWQLEEGGTIYDKKDHGKIYCSYHEPGRGDLHFSGGINEKIQFHRTHENTQGVTNLGQGYISGQTNHFNRFYSAIGDGEISCGDGSKKSFVRRKRKRERDSCDLHEEISPSGHKKRYLYFDEKNRDVYGVDFWVEDSRIATTIFHKSKEGFDMRLPFERLPGTHCEPYKKAKNEGINRIYDKIERAESCSLQFEYWMREVGPRRDYIFNLIPARFPKAPRSFRFYIQKRQEGNSSALFLHYYDAEDIPKEERRPRDRREFYGSQDGKVRIIEQGLGKERSELAKFIYRDKLTEVLYGKGYREYFLIDHRERVKETQTYLGTEPQIRVSYTWGDEGHLTGNLLQKEIFRMNEGSFRERTYYEYDESGNVLKERKRANFSGEGEEELIRTFSYSTDGFNLLLSEEDGRCKKRYRYKPGTNLTTAIFLEDRGKVIQRRFQEFNAFGAPCLRIEDDGTEEEKESLKNVTERRIERLNYHTEGPHIGLVESSSESFLDAETKKEIPLRSLKHFYDGKGNRIQTDVYDADGNFAYSLFTEFNGHRLPKKNIDALGCETSYEYSDIDQLTLEKREAVCKISAYTNTKLLKEEGFISPNGEKYLTKRIYDSRLNLKELIDPRGNVTSFTYDGFGRELSRTDPIGATSYKEYDVDGNITKEIDANGNATEKKYSSFGKVTSIHYPDGSSEHFTYDLYGNITKRVLRNESYILHTFDLLNRELERKTFSKEGALLSVSTRRYSGFRLVEEIDPAGLVTTYSYDGAGRVTSKKEGEHLTTFSYDATGNLSIKCIDSLETRYCYDFKGQLLSEAIYFKDELQKLEEYRYDSEGRKTATIAHTSAGLAISETEYDYIGRMTCTTNPLGESTTFEYIDVPSTEKGKSTLLKVTTEPSGTKLKELHDANERVILSERISPLGKLLARESFRYDLAGNLIEKTLFSIQEGEVKSSLTIEFAYDSMNQQIRMTEQPGTENERTTHTTYTLFGQKSSVIKPDGKEITYLYNAEGVVSRFYSSDFDYSFTYSPLLQILTATDEIHHTVTQRSYDLYGNLISETTPDFTVTTDYDPLSRPIRFSYGHGMSMEHHYEGILLKKIDIVSGWSRFETHYADHDLSGRYHKLGDTTFKRDLVGREIAIEHPHFSQTEITYSPSGEPLSFLRNGEKKEFIYDDLHQLTAENGASYSYDSLNRRLIKNGLPHSYSPLNELLHDGTKSLSYDALGRCIQDGEWTFSYDSLDRLIKATSKKETITYSYDAFSRCISRNKCRFIYQGQNEIGTLERGYVTEFRFLGIGKGAEIGAAVLLYLNGTYGIPIHDIQGSVSAITSPSGSPLNSYSYSAFGELLTAKEYTSCPWLFSSKRQDPSLKLYQFGRRHYDPSRGRWTTPDPKSYSEGPNLYAYVANNPLALFDLYGLEIATRHFRNKNEPKVWPSQAIGREFTRLSQKLYPLASPDGSRIRYYSDTNKNHRTDVVGGENVGILSLQTETEQRTQNLSEAGKDANGRPMAATGLHIPSHGIVPDLIHCSLEMCGYCSHATIYTYNQIYSLAMNNPNAHIIYTAYSRGTIALNNALRMLPDHILNRLHVIALGPARFVPIGRLASSVNIVRDTDPVPMIIAHANKSIRALYSDDKYNIEYVPGNGPADHARISYEPDRNRHIEKITDQLMNRQISNLAN